MGMNINNPVCATVETVASPTPPEGMRGLVAKGDGWYDYTSDGQQEKILDESDVANELPASNGETLWSGELTGKLLDKKADADALVGIKMENGNEVFNDKLTNKANTMNSHVEGSGNSARTGNAHVEGLKNDSIALWGFQVVSKDNDYTATDDVSGTSTITLDSVEGISVGMVWNVFAYVSTEHETYVKKYRGNISAVDVANNKVTLLSSQGDSEFELVSGLNTDSPIGYFIVEGGTIGSTRIYDRSGEFSSHAEGSGNISYFNSHAEGCTNKALGYSSHAEGYKTQALGERGHAEGYNTIAQGHESHAEGYNNKSIGFASHAEGAGSESGGYASHTSGISTRSNGKGSFAEGHGSIADGEASHAEGEDCNAKADSSHAEGYKTISAGWGSHAEGHTTQCTGWGAHVEGIGCIATGGAQHAQGRYNIKDTSGTYLDIVGNGDSDTKRSNAYTLDWEGNGWFAGGVKVGSDAKELATKEYVDDTGNAKVDKVEGKVLSSNDFTDANKETLDYIAFNQGEMIITGFGCRVKTNHNYFGDNSNSENHFRGQNDFEDGKLSVWKPSATSGGMPPYHTKLTGDDVIIYRLDDVSVEEHRLSKKEDIFTVQNSITGSSLVLTDHTDTRLTAAAVTALTVTLPETIPDTYAAAFSFVSGTTATALTASGIKWQGADCNASGVFIPAANTNYEVSVKCIGKDADNQPILVARVGVF